MQQKKDVIDDLAAYVVDHVLFLLHQTTYLPPFFLIIRT